MFLCIFFSFYYVCVCVCVYFCPPLSEVCRNHDVVVCQPWTGTTSDLGSVTNYNFILALLLHLSQPFFWIFSFLLFPTNPQSLEVCSRITSILHQITTSSKYRPPGSRLHSPPASLRRLTICPAPCAYVCCRLPCPLVPPLLPLAYDQVPVSPWGFFHHGYSRLPCAYTYPPCVLLRLLTPSGSWFLVRWPFSSEVDMPRRLHFMASARPGPCPPDIWPFQRRS